MSTTYGAIRILTELHLKQGEDIVSMYTSDGLR